jgi:hypothetical protein
VGAVWDVGRTSDRGSFALPYYLRHGWFGLVLGLGGAFSIMAWYDDNPGFAGFVAIATVIAALCVFLFVDEPRRRRMKGPKE